MDYARSFWSFRWVKVYKAMQGSVKAEGKVTKSTRQTRIRTRRHAYYVGAIEVYVWYLHISSPFKSAVPSRSTALTFPLPLPPSCPHSPNAPSLNIR